MKGHFQTRLSFLERATIGTTAWSFFPVVFGVRGAPPPPGGYREDFGASLGPTLAKSFLWGSKDFAPEEGGGVSGAAGRPLSET